MSASNLEALPIDESLRLRLSELLSNFESYRIYNDTIDIEDILEDDDDTAKSKKGKGFLERLFM